MAPARVCAAGLATRSASVCAACSFDVSVGLFVGADFVETEVELSDIGNSRATFRPGLPARCGRLHDIAVIGYVECKCPVVLDQQHRQVPLVSQALDDSENLLDEERFKTQ